MIQLVSVTLENEMDLILAYKKSIKVCELIGLTISTQTSFATAVSEVCREVIDKTFDGLLILGAHAEGARYFFEANIRFTLADPIRNLQEGFEYAKKLVPAFNLTSDDSSGEVMLRLGIPRSAKLVPQRINEIKRYFEIEEPLSPYEEVKRRNIELDLLSEQQKLELLQAIYLNDQKDEFLSVASHELNTPLTILKSYTQLAMRAEEGQNPVLANYLKKIEAQTGKLNALIQQLLDVSKIELGRTDYNKEHTELNAFINQATEASRLLIPGYQLAIELDAEVNVYIDRLRMEQVLNNLISNAAKYSQSGSQIDIFTTINDGKVKISVKDVGIGMSAETISNVFNKFYRDESVVKKYKGLGMGLYIAARIVSDHESEIEVESVEGEGSTFCFSLAVV